MEVHATEKGKPPQVGVLLLQTNMVPLSGKGHGSHTSGEDKEADTKQIYVGLWIFFMPTCHTSACVYYRCRWDYLSLKRSATLCQENKKKRMMILLSQLCLEHNASIKASGKKENILKVKEYFRIGKREVTFNTGVSVMVLYSMRKHHSSP